MINKHKPKIPSIINKLQQSKESFNLLTKQDSLYNTEWLENNFPIAPQGRIDWQKLPESFCLKYSNDSELLLAFEEIVVRHKLEGNLIVSWYDALILPVQLDMDVLRRNIREIFQEDWDTWICNQEDEWCIENHHDGEICFGKCLK